MWEAISKLGTTPLTLLFAAGLIICIIVMIKKGIFSFNKNGIKIGNSGETERRIIRAQLDAATASNQYIMEHLPEKLRNDHGKLVAELCFDKVVEWIILNNLTDDPIYISLKQEQILTTILSNTTDTFFRTPECMNFFNEEVEKLIKKLYKIKIFYEKN